MIDDAAVRLCADNASWLVAYIETTFGSKELNVFQEARDGNDCLESERLFGRRLIAVHLGTDDSILTLQLAGLRSFWPFGLGRPEVYYILGDAHLRLCTRNNKLIRADFWLE